MVGVREAWNAFWFTGYSVEGLGLLRRYFGIGLFFFNFTQVWSLFLIDITGESFYYIRPVWYFEVLGFTQNVPIFDYLAIVVLQVATLTMAFGYRTRLSTILVMVLIVYLRGVRDSLLGGSHHRYHVPFEILLFLSLSRCGEANSVDARRKLARGEATRPVPEWESSWPIVAMQVYTASFYFWSVIAKFKFTGWQWFSDPRRIQDLLLTRSLVWGATDAGEPTFNPLPYWLSQQETLCLILGLSTLVMEAGFPLILIIRRPLARFIFLCGVALFHVANFVFAYVGFILFPITFLIFFDLEDVRRRFVSWRGSGVGT
jgi:hypothetical protein